MNKERIIEINDLKVHFPLKESTVKAVDGVSWHINKGETVGHNTDIIGFEKAIKETNYNFVKKKSFDFRGWRSCPINYICTTKNGCKTYNVIKQN